MARIGSSGDDISTDDTTTDTETDTSGIESGIEQAVSDAAAVGRALQDDGAGTTTEPDSEQSDTSQDTTDPTDVPARGRGDFASDPVSTATDSDPTPEPGGRDETTGQTGLGDGQSEGGDGDTLDTDPTPDIPDEPTQPDVPDVDQGSGGTDMPGAMPGSDTDQATTVGNIAGRDQQGINEPVEQTRELIESGPSGDGQAPGAMPGSQTEQATTTQTIAEDTDGARSKAGGTAFDAGVGILQSGVYGYTRSNPVQAEKFRENVVNPLVGSITDDDSTDTTDAPGAMPGSQPEEQATTAPTISGDATNALGDDQFQAGIVRALGGIPADAIGMSDRQRVAAIREGIVDPFTSEIGGESDRGETDAPGAMSESQPDEQATTTQTIAEEEQEGIGEADALRRTFARGAGEAVAGVAAIPSGAAGATEAGVKGAKYTGRQVRQEGLTEGLAQSARAGTNVAEATTDKVTGFVANNPALAAGALSTAVIGSVAAGRGLGIVGRGVKGRIRTVGGTEIDLDDVTQRSVIEGDDDFPGAQDPDTYQTDPAKAVRTQAEDMTPDEIKQSYTQAGVDEGVTLKKAVDTEPEGPESGRAAQGLRVQEGSYESPGGFVGPELSPYFLGTESSAGYSLRPGLPDFGGKPTGAFIRTDVDSPDATTLDEFGDELRQRSGETTAYTKPAGEVATGEIEAVIPPRATFADVGSGPVRNTLRKVGVGSDYYTTYQGRRVPLRVVAPEKDIDATEGMDVDVPRDVTGRVIRPRSSLGRSGRRATDRPLAVGPLPTTSTTTTTEVESGDTTGGRTTPRDYQTRTQDIDGSGRRITDGRDADGPQDTDDPTRPRDTDPTDDTTTTTDVGDTYDPPDVTPVNPPSTGTSTTTTTTDTDTTPTSIPPWPGGGTATSPVDDGSETTPPTSQGPSGTPTGPSGIPTTPRITDPGIPESGISTTPTGSPVGDDAPPTPPTDPARTPDYDDDGDDEEEVQFATLGDRETFAFDFKDPLTGNLLRTQLNPYNE